MGKNCKNAGYKKTALTKNTLKIKRKAARHTRAYHPLLKTTVLVSLGLTAAQSWALTHSLADGDNIYSLATSLNSGDEINFSGNAVMFGSGSSVSMTLPDSLTMSGAAGGTTITMNNGAGSYGRFALSTSSTNKTFSISNVTFTGGYVSGSGAVFGLTGGSSKITMAGNGVAFTGNIATNQGGAIYANNTGGIEFSGEVTFSNNYAQNTSSAGGAIYSASNVIFSDASATAIFTGNYSRGSGGAIWTDGSVTVAGNAEFQNNQTSYQQSYGYGGAIRTKSGFYATNTNGSINFANNSAYSGGGALDSNSNVSFAGNASFSNNRTTTGVGGAIRIDSAAATSNVTFTNSNGIIQFEQNYAASYGGGIYAYTVTGAGHMFLDQNIAGQSGGAIYALASTSLGSTGTQLEITGNKAGFNNTGTSVVTTSGYGGAVFSAGTIRLASNAGDISSNIASGYGGALYAQGQTELAGQMSFADNLALYYDGGAVYAQQALQVEATGSSGISFVSNMAAQNGGAIFLQGSGTAAQNTSTLHANSGNIIFSGNKSQATRVGLTLTGGVANAIHLNNASANSTLNLLAQNNQYIAFLDPITSTAANGNVAININSNDGGVSTTGGRVIFSGENFAAGSADVQSNVYANTTVYGGTFEVKDNAQYGASTADNTSFTVKQGGQLLSTASSSVVDNIVRAQDIGFDHGASITANGTGTLTLDAQAVTLGSSASDAVNVNVNNSDVFTLDADLSGAGGIAKQGSGTLVLNTVNTNTGLNTINHGTLLLGESSAHTTAQLSGNIQVNNGGVLSGFGAATGVVNVGNGGTIAPGNAAGVQTGTLYLGQAILGAGSTFQYEALPDGTVDLLVVDSTLGTGDGTVTINSGARLDVQGGPGTWKADREYTLITADGGVSGTFTEVDKHLAFLDHEVLYNPDSVQLVFTRNSTSFDNVGLTYNQRNTGTGIESLGAGNLVYDAIVSMTAQQARDSFDNLSGEIHGSVKSAALHNSRYVRNAVSQHLSGNQGAAQLDPDAHRNLWVSTWVHDGNLKNDGNATRLDNKGWGVLVGYDAYENNGTVAGVALGYEQTELDAASTRSSSADVDAVHMMVYGRSSLGPVDLKGGAGYSWLDVDTQRHVTVPTLVSNNEASYKGGLFQMFVEGSHTFTLTEQASLTPYASLAYQRVKTRSFTEKADTVPGVYTQLHNNSTSDGLATSTLGVRGNWQLSETGTNLYADLGWQHQFGSTAPEVSLNFAGGTRFNVRGTEVNRNAVQIGIGANIILQPNMQLSIGYEGLFGNQSRDHAAKLLWEIKF